MPYKGARTTYEAQVETKARIQSGRGRRRHADQTLIIVPAVEMRTIDDTR